ncbi:hypothetical protein FACS1894163_11350 [Spirochaetia bacterium]|nr:hypothetical protein FACS1894163_11350 [Spirochaetia bacterium]
MIAYLFWLYGILVEIVDFVKAEHAVAAGIILNRRRSDDNPVWADFFVGMDGD